MAEEKQVEEKAVSSPNASFGRILGNLTANTQTLVRKEVELVQARTKERVTDQVKSKAVPIGMLVGAGIFALLALAFLGVMLILGLGDWFDMALWISALIVMLLYLIIAAILGLVGRAKLQSGDEGESAADATTA